MFHQRWKRWIFIIGVSVVIGMIGLAVTVQWLVSGASASQPITIPYLAGNAPVASMPLTIRSTPREVIALMLNSHTRWQTLQAKAISIIVDDPRSNKLQTDIREIQIEQYGKVRAESGPAGQPPTFIWISDGITMWAQDVVRGAYTEQPVPEDVRSLETYGPPMPPPDGQAFVVRYPLDGVICSALAEYVFPHGLAQSFSPGELDVIGTELVAGRETIIVLWQVRKNGVPVKKHKYWIDGQTGVVLKGEVYAEIPGWDRWVEHVTMTEIAYDRPIPPEPFTFQPAPNSKRSAPDLQE